MADPPNRAQLQAAASLIEDDPVTYHILATAALYGQNSLMSCVLDGGHSVETVGPLGTPLQAASLMGNELTVRMLLERSASINVCGPFMDPLQAAAINGHLSIVNLLLQNGASVNATGGVYGTALQAAAHRGHRDVAEVLLDAGARMEIPGRFRDAFHAAAHAGQADVVRLLFDKGYRFDVSPLETSSHGLARPLIPRKNLLREASPSRSKDRGHVRMESQGYEDTALFPSLPDFEELLDSLDKAVIPWSKAEDMQTSGRLLTFEELNKEYDPLEVAVVNNHHGVFSFILENRVKLRVRPSHLSNALAAASRIGNIRMIQTLAAIDDTLQPSSIRAAIYEAVSHGQVATLEVLLEYEKKLAAPAGDPAYPYHHHPSAAKLRKFHASRTGVTNPRATPLLAAAARSGDTATLARALALAATARERESLQRAALREAAAANDPATLSFLLLLLFLFPLRTIASDRAINSAIHDAAARAGHLAGLSYLLAQLGADPAASISTTADEDEDDDGDGEESEAGIGVAVLLVHEVVARCGGATVRAWRGGASLRKALSAAVAAVAAGREAGALEVLGLVAGAGAAEVEVGRQEVGAEEEQEDEGQAWCPVLGALGREGSREGGVQVGEKSAFSWSGAVVRWVLKRFPELGVSGKGSGFLLQVAVVDGDRELVRLLTQSGVDVNHAGHYYGTALQAAARFGRTSLVHHLLEKGADVNILGGAYGSALQAAVAAEELEIVRILIDHGANVNAHYVPPTNHLDDRPPPLAIQLAVQSGNIEITKNLLDAGADVDADPERGRMVAATGGSGTIFERPTPLITACGRADGFELAKLLIERGAVVNASAKPPVHYADDWVVNQAVCGEVSPLLIACWKGHDRIVQLLLDSGADLKTNADCSMDPLTIAARAGHLKVVELLLRHGAAIYGLYHAPALPNEAIQADRHKIVQLLQEKTAGLPDAACRETLKMAVLLFEALWASQLDPCIFEAFVLGLLEHRGCCLPLSHGVMRQIPEILLEQGKKVHFTSATRDAFGRNAWAQEDAETKGLWLGLDEKQEMECGWVMVSATDADHLPR